MTEKKTPKRATARGRIDKRQAILDAAFRVFACDGYGQACVKDIAAEAQVAKPTIYNHMHDKESLFRESVEAAAARTTARMLAVLERLREPGDDVRAALEDAGHRLLVCHCDEESWALRRLVYAETAKFPELLDTVQRDGAQRVQQALADRLARLSLAGKLDARDPDVAAEQFLALLTGPLETRSRLGTRPVSEGELMFVTQAAVDTFLRAYAGGLTQQAEEVSDRTGRQVR